MTPPTNPSSDDTLATASTSTSTTMMVSMDKMVELSTKMRDITQQTAALEAQFSALRQSQASLTIDLMTMMAGAKTAEGSGAAGTATATNEYGNGNAAPTTTTSSSRTTRGSSVLKGTFPETSTSTANGTSTSASTAVATDVSPFRPPQQQPPKAPPPKPPQAAMSKSTKTASSSSRNQTKRKDLNQKRRNQDNNNANESQLHDSVERELVKVVCTWSHRVVVHGAGAGALILWLNNQPIYINPALCSLVGIVTAILLPNDLELQTACSLVFISCAIIKHSISQGCSASLVPAIYGFIPCAFGFLFRNTKAVKLATLGVLAATSIIFTVDVAGFCTSEPIQPHQKGYILADRLVPLLMLILGNCVVLVVIVQQSQESTKLHAQAARSAARLADTRRDVLHRVTHELRTPLNGLVGSVELLTTSETLSAEDMENVLCMKRCLASIVRICDDVLMVAKSRGIQQNNNSSKAISTMDDNGKANQQMSASASSSSQKRNNNSKVHTSSSVFRMATVVDDVTGMFAAAAYSKGIAFRVHFVGRTNQWVRGMEGELRQVLLNLCGNALKFTTQGSITVTVEELQTTSDNHDKDDAASRPRTTTQYYLAVHDTGIGIDPRNADQLFEPFQQGEQGSAVSRQHQGTGLGLTICREFVAQMGSKIHVEGQRGVGATFHFTVPFQNEDEPPLLEDDTDDEDDDENHDNRNADPYLGPCHVVIADSEQESSATCKSIVKSMAPNATIRTTDDIHGLVNNGNEINGEDAGVPKVAFVMCNDENVQAQSSMSILFELKSRGWHVIANCDQTTFPQLVAKQQSGHIMAVFRRPVPLVRMANSFRASLVGSTPAGAALPPVVKSPQDSDDTASTVASTTASATATPTESNDQIDENDKHVQTSQHDPQPVVVARQVEPLLTPSSKPLTPNGVLTNNGAARDKPPNASVPNQQVSSVAVQLPPQPQPLPQPQPQPQPQQTAKRRKKPSVELHPGSKVVVVDDTPVNVKVLCKMLNRSVTVPVESCFDGQSAIDLMKASNRGDNLLFLMDWHMPGICGLTASESIRQIAQERGENGPRVYVCMVTADIEGLHTEMEKLDISYDGTVSNGRLDHHRMEEYTVVDLLADKPVTFKSIQAILEWFRQQVEHAVDYG